MKGLLSLAVGLVLALLIASAATRIPTVAAQDGTTEEDTIEAATNGDQSFFAPETWLQELTRQQGWGPEYPRMLADVNGDGKQDIIGFGRDGVWLATSNGSSFSPAFVLADFGYQSGWRAAKHVRLAGDVNGDRRADVVGFGDAGVYRALSTGTGFGTVNFVLADFGYNQGWRVDKHVRLLADVNGDGRKDIVAFGDAGVWLSLATPDGSFTPPAFVLADFGYNQGWRLDKHIRTTADINGDGRQDIVAFGDAGVWIALSTGTGFGPAQFVLADFGYSAGSWRVDRHVRVLADIDHDGKQDIVGFGDAGVYTARSTGGSFEAARFVLADFGYNQGWRVGTHPRFVADLNGDGYPDLVGFGNDSVYRSLGGPAGFAPMRAMLRALVVNQGFPWNSSASALADYFPRLVGDVNGDGMQDLVAFDTSDVKVVRSSNLPPPPPPAAPTNPRVTGTTTSSLSIAWKDNSNNERKFLISYAKSGSTKRTEISVGANVTSATLGNLDTDSQYCFTVQAENVFGLSAKSSTACGRTRPKP
ncbi:MAG: VCBS repeat-containing protein, partial [Anaerolineae bacterium]|nr:VCBS repeat-containing protein [Anaerolineae bacterium]